MPAFPLIKLADSIKAILFKWRKIIASGTKTSNWVISYYLEKSTGKKKSLPAMNSTHQRLQAFIPCSCLKQNLAATLSNWLNASGLELGEKEEEERESAPRSGFGESSDREYVGCHFSRQTCFVFFFPCSLGTKRFTSGTKNVGRKKSIRREGEHMYVGKIMNFKVTAASRSVLASSPVARVMCDGVGIWLAVWVTLKRPETMWSTQYILRRGRFQSRWTEPALIADIPMCPVVTSQTIILYT